MRIAPTMVASRKIGGHGHFVTVRMPVRIW